MLLLLIINDMKWGKSMTNPHTNFWENAFTEMIEKSNQFMQDSPFLKMDTLFEDSLSRFKEFSTMMQKLSGWDLMTNFKTAPGLETNPLFEQARNFMNFDKLFEESIARFKELSSYTEQFKPMALFMNPAELMTMDFKKSGDEFLKLMGLISIDEYQSLIKKYEELKKLSQDFEKIQNEQAQKISELNQVATAEKKKAATREKSVDENKARLDEQKKIAAGLTKELDAQKKQALSLEKELNELKKQNDALKKDISDKELLLKKNQADKA